MKTSYQLDGTPDQETIVLIETASFEKTIAKLLGKYSNIFMFVEKKVLFVDPLGIFLGLKKNQRILLIPFAASEGEKDICTALKIVEIFDSHSFVRGKDIALFVGGGVMTDIGSFAASIYRRGIDYIRVPTTLLGQVDAGIGLKTAVNYNDGKNRIGTFYAPRQTVIDPQFLSTLEVSEFKNGVAEMLKIAIIKSAPLLRELVTHATSLCDAQFYATSQGISIIQLSVRLLMEEISRDPRERNRRRCADFGHILSPWLEYTEQWKIPHGQAIVYEIDFALTLALCLGENVAPLRQAFQTVTSAVGLKQNCAQLIKPEFLDQAIKKAKMHREGYLNFPIPTGNGEHRILQDIDDGIIAATLTLYSSAFT